MKTAVVLGATAGVGKAIAEELWYNNSYSVVGFHRGNYKFGTMWGGANVLIQRDAGSTLEDVAVCIHDVMNVGQKVNVLVHSITGAGIGSVLQTTDIERTFYRLAHSFLQWVRLLYASEQLAPDARIIALSNPCPDFYLRNTGVIGAAKAALEAYVKMLAVELGPTGVRVNCVRFGMVKTPAIEKVLNETALQHMQKVNERLTPAGRMQTAEDVAKIVKWLVSDDAYWINGAIIDATGGGTSTLLDYAFYGPR